ncbi:MAG: hypothetical protein MN733_36340 [Nitrososphaera sp.]|nr:hypothetical protein [Nitrososphaera sp.]
MSKHEHIPEDLQELYEVYDYRHAGAILACEFPDKCQEVFSVLRSFRFTKDQILKGGGNESEIPKAFSTILRPLGWKEGQLKAKFIVDEEEVTSDTHKLEVRNWIFYSDNSGLYKSMERARLT